MFIDTQASFYRPQDIASPAICLPKVSIGLPVYNGENFIKEAIASLLAQTFQDYELIICDNASTDNTEAICRDYASQDSRIRYYRNAVNQGPAWNYNRTFELAQGEYFKWAAHDDVFAPTFLEKILARFERNPAAVLSFSKVNVIDEEAGKTEPYDVDLATDSPVPARRFQEMISLKHRCYEIFGLIRADVLAQTPLIGSYAGSDRALLGRLSLHGPFEIVPERLFGARSHAKQSIAMLRKPQRKHLRMHHYAVWFDPKNKGKILLPNWRILHEYLAAIETVSLSFGNRLKCYLVMVIWLFSNRNLAKLLRDLAIALAQIAGKVATRVGMAATERSQHKNSDSPVVLTQKATAEQVRHMPTSTFRTEPISSSLGQTHSSPQQ